MNRPVPHRPRPRQLLALQRSRPVSFRPTVVLGRRHLSTILVALDDLATAAGGLSPRVAGAVRSIAGELRLDLGAEDGASETVELPKARVLDATGALVDAATALAKEGRHVAAFALEGIEGRLLESLVTPVRTATRASERTPGCRYLHGR